MMNLLARILSHGFALAVVAFIAIVLIYRGELFPDLELPESMAIKSQSGTTAEVVSGAEETSVDEATVSTDMAAVAAKPAEKPSSSASASNANDDIHAADQTAAAPAMDAADEPTDDVVPVASRDSTESSDTAPASDTLPEVATDEPSMADPMATETDADKDTDVTPVPTQDVVPDEAGTTVDESLSAVTEDVPPAVEMAPAAVEESAPAEMAPVAAEESAPAEMAPVTAIAEETASVEIAPAAAEESVPVEMAPVTATAEETAPAVIAPAAAEEAVPAEMAPVTATTEETAPVVIEPTAAEEQSATAVVIPPAEPLAAPDEETAADTASETPYEIMAKAREAFWLRDFETAEQQYRQLTQLDPDNPDGYGEMGNMYFSQGKWDEAAAAYYEAGTRLLEEGHVEQAQQMVEVILGLNGPRADDLAAQIGAASSSSH